MLENNAKEIKAKVISLLMRSLKKWQLFYKKPLKQSPVSVFVRRGIVRSGNCPVGELSGWGIVRRGIVHRGIVRVGTVLVGIVRVGNCPSGNCPSGNCPSGNCPSGYCPVGELSGNPKIQYFICSRSPLKSGGGGLKSCKLNTSTP